MTSNAPATLAMVLAFGVISGAVVAGFCIGQVRQMELHRVAIDGMIQISCHGARSGALEERLGEIERQCRELHEQLRIIEVGLFATY